MKLAQINYRPGWDSPPDWDRIRRKVQSYLHSGAMVMQAMSNGVDQREPARGATVPVGFRTDGNWVWALGVEYYTDTYGLPVEPDFIAHMRERGFLVPTVNSADLEAAVVTIEEIAKRFAESTETEI